ncbi:UDP-N-acetylbacillosamine N-acetyltransferase [Aliarcobacter cryaerophilus]|uniref:UDP-N-acetylbacillosamine N-acetyltransferase n=1 Tax=Aliarcobacter cryaerophilus TaxID=28198 RepID=UPI0021B1AA1A|nr:UDP-N-acetylbacillosamine N-acetyltransferase [Aliarcobacter cryaerophilus]MCT7495748.1 UDP-N-acetylbacillosamine N-acetyltransferase [Aliarcobacter cryaerophilus]
MSKRIYIYGASGHGLVVADVAKSCGYEDIVFLDDDKSKGFLTFDNIKENRDYHIAFGIGNNQIRAKLYKKVKENGFSTPILIHPSSIISSSARIEEGTVVMPNVVVNAKAYIGKCVILNSSCVVEHECKIDNFVHISPNVALAGDVKIGDFTHIGIGSSVIQCLEIGKNSIIGAGSVVVKNIADFKKAYGTPCKEIGNIDE